MGLRVQILEGDEWITVGRVPDTGPIAWKDVAVVVPAPGGDRVRVVTGGGSSDFSAVREQLDSLASPSGTSPARMRHSTTAHSPPDCSPAIFSSALEPWPDSTVRPPPGPVRTGLLKDICHSFLIVRVRATRAVEINLPGARTRMSTARCTGRAYVPALVSAGDRETSLGHGVVPLTRRYDLGPRACWQDGDESGELRRSVRERRR